MVISNIGRCAQDNHFDSGRQDNFTQPDVRQQLLSIHKLPFLKIERIFRNGHFVNVLPIFVCCR